MNKVPVLFKTPMSKNKQMAQARRSSVSPEDDMESMNQSQLQQSFNRDGLSARRSIVMNRNQQQAFLRQSVIGVRRNSIQNSTYGGGQFLEFNPKKYITRTLTQTDVLQLKQVFDYYDSENAGMLSPNDLKQLLQNNGYFPTKDTLYEIFAEMDTDDIGGIAFDNFILMIDPEKFQEKMEKTEKKDTVRRVYRKYDKKNKGFILFEDLLYVIDHDLKEENIDKDLIQEIFEKVDSNRDGKITFEEFYTVMNKKSYF